MLFRKIEKDIEDHLKSKSDKILVIGGARQVGKSYIIRTVGQRLFSNFIELNFVRDCEGAKLYKNISTTDDFYFTLSMEAGDRLGNRDDTLVFLDEIQQYPQFLTLLKFLREENRFTYICSGSLLGVSLKKTTSIPVGSIVLKQMFQLDFEEFLIANGFGDFAIGRLREHFVQKDSLDEATHQHIMQLYKRYLLVGGFPDVVNEYLFSRNIVKVRALQKAIYGLYGDDAVKYEDDNGKKLYVKRIYDMIPSQMENKKKRLLANEIQSKKSDRFSHYEQEFEFLTGSGIALDVHAVSNPTYPLNESEQKNLLKLYLNDVGLLTAELYGNDLQPVLNDQCSVNLGAVYENVVAQELKAHGHSLFYYDNRKLGEVDFLVNDRSRSCIMPIEVKSGKDYTIHHALDNLINCPDYLVGQAIVLSNERVIRQIGLVTYLPVYFVMFLEANVVEERYVLF